MKSQNFVALDLELNKNEEGTNRIIQVGIAIGNPTTPEDIKTFSWYINPEEKIDPFITQLTGITDEIIQEKAVDHKTVAQEFGELLKVYDVFCNPITWGQGDASELKAEFRERDIYFPFFGRRIFDVKTIYVFNQFVKGRSPSGGLRKSMNSYGIPFEGISHRADVDAKNTLRFFFYLMQRQKTFENVIEQMRSMK